MRRSARVSAGIAVLLVLAIGPALFLFPRAVAAQEGDTVTTVLQPGLNLAGWTENESSVEAIFDDIPALDLVYAWDAEDQRFRLAMRADPGGFSDLRKLTPGMGLWLFITGNEPVTWARPIIAEAAYAPLREGWNLVIWGGEDGIASRTALQDIDDILTMALDVNSRWPLMLRTGQAYWLDVSGSREWNQIYVPAEIEFLAAFSQEKQDEVRAHVDDVVEFFFQRLGLRVPGLTIRFGDSETFFCGGYYHESVITLGQCVDYVFEHEYVHAIQDHLAGEDEFPPSWFREGHADFWAALYADARGDQDYVRYMHQLVLPSAHSQGFVQSGLSYHSYHVRLHVLVKREGPDALNEFLRKVGELGDWRAAFEGIYGMTVDEFNVVFAQEMLLVPVDNAHACPLDWYEPIQSPSQASDQTCGTIQGVVTDLAGSPRSGVLAGLVLGALRHNDGLHDAQQRTESDGAFSLTVPEGSYTLLFIPGRLGPDFPFPGVHYYNVQRGLLHNSLAADWINPVPEPEPLVIAYGVIAGEVVTEEGEPASGIRIDLIDSKDRRYVEFSPGAFQFFVGSDTYLLEVGCPGRKLGWYGGDEGFVQSRSEATPIVLQDADITDLSIRLPAGVSCE